MIGPLPPLKDNLTVVKRNRAPWVEGRKIAMVSSGVHVEGSHLPIPDPQHPDSLIIGIHKRFGYQPPEPDPEWLEEICGFTLNWCKKNLVPLPPDSNTTVERWLRHTSYEAWRKKELYELAKNVENPYDPVHSIVKSFQKEEQYEEYKYPRAINARSDYFKTMSGPIFKLIEEQLFALPWFIKKVPRHKWSEKIMNTLDPQARIIATDYSAFEAHFIRPIMKKIEFVMYRYMTKYLPEHRWFSELCDNVIAGRNTCKFKYLTVKIDATRMSGEMNTSLGNGFSNLMLMLFACHKVGATDVRGFVEGDDGLFTMRGKVPTTELFAKLGFTIKLVEHERISTASFCGMVFNEEDRINVTNPLKVISKLGWCSPKYTKAKNSKLLMLLKAKALSNAYQYPQCPIVIAATRWVLRCTKHIDLRPYFANRGIQDYEKAELRRALAHLGELEELITKPVPIKTRLLVEELYGVNYNTQVWTERWFDMQNELCPIPDTLFRQNVPSSWKNFYEGYVDQVDVSSYWLERSTNTQIKPAPLRAE